MPAINNPAQYAFSSPNGAGVEGGFSRDGDDAHRVASAARDSRICRSSTPPTQAALATLDRVGSVVNYQPPTGVVYAANDALAQAFRAVAGAMVRGIGTKVFWVHDGRVRHARHAEHRTRRTPAIPT